MKILGYWQGWYSGFESGWLEGYRAGRKITDEPADLFF